MTPPPSAPRGTLTRESADKMPISLSVKLVLPMPPNIANGRLHWRAKQRAKIGYYATCDYLQSIGLVPPPPARPFTRSRITVTAFVARRHDLGNLMHRVEKWPCDWLKTRGYVVDDSPEHLEWSGLPRQQVTKRSEARIEITLDNLTKVE